MALPQDGQNANALATVKEVPTGKKLIFVDPTTNEGGIITLEDLTTQILKKLTSQTFALDQGTKTLPAALNELNSKPLFSNISDITIEVSNTNDDPVELAFPIDTEFLYVSYGIKNNVQSYGGATLIIDVKEVKPCFVPVYTNANVEGYLYLYPNPETHKLKIYGINLQAAMLVKVKCR